MADLKLDMPENAKKPQFFANIEDFLLKKEYSIKINNLEEFTDTVIAYTGISKEAAEKLVTDYFQEIRSQILKGNQVTLPGIGNVLITSPGNEKSKRITPKIKVFGSFIRKLNDRS